jgi:serine/threonine protein phosphatase PrpC
MYTIGQFAALTGLTPRALRFYDSLGLLRARRDPDNGYRHYTEHDLRLARRIALLRTLGFSLPDIADLLFMLSDSGETRQVVEAFRARLARYREQRAEIERQEEALRGLMSLLSSARDPDASLSRIAALTARQRREMMHALQLQSAKLSARGPREHNEDRAWIQPSETGGLYIVADGCGPAGRGQDAGQRACEAFAEHLDIGALTAGRWAGHLQELVARADAAVRLLRTDEGIVATTLTALILHEGVAYLAHVGDTRAYRREGDTLVQLTLDHTVAQRLRDEGQIGAEALRDHPQRHLLTSAVGHLDAASRALVHREELRDDACYLLVSDGITRVLDDQGMLDILQEEPDAVCAVERMVARAEAEGDDNATAIVVMRR